MLLSETLAKSFNEIDSLYLKMIEKLSVDREELTLIRENYGLSTDEASFLEIVQNN